MPTRSVRNDQRGEQAPPGDFTAMEKARLEDANAEELAEAEARMALVSKRNAEAAEQGVFDPQTQSVVEGPELLDDDDEEIELDPSGVVPADAARIDGPLSPSGENRAQQVIQRQQSRSGQSVELLEDEEDPIEQETRIGRVTMDLENVTFGQGNTFTFKRGLRYRMPRALYDHLDSRGYIFH
jgi:hypothetical protein